VPQSPNFVPQGANVELGADFSFATTRVYLLSNRGLLSRGESSGPLKTLAGIRPSGFAWRPEFAASSRLDAARARL